MGYRRLKQGPFKLRMVPTRGLHLLQETFVRVLGVDGTGDAWRVEALDLYSDEACTSRLAMGTVTNYYATMLDSSGAESYTCPCWGGDHGSCPCNDASTLASCEFLSSSCCFRSL